MPIRYRSDGSSGCRRGKSGKHCNSAGAEKVPAGGERGRKRATVSSCRRRPESRIVPNSLTFIAKYRASALVGATFPWFSTLKWELQPFFSSRMGARPCWRQVFLDGQMTQRRGNCGSNHKRGRGRKMESRRGKSVWNTLMRRGSSTQCAETLQPFLHFGLRLKKGNEIFAHAPFVIIHYAKVID